jgi:hypothetical protein
MKHLKLLPLLIAAAFVLPRAHAAEQHQAPQREIGSGAALACIGLLLLGANRAARSDTFKPLKEE